MSQQSSSTLFSVSDYEAVADSGSHFLNQATTTRPAPLSAHGMMD
jgi:hypothetical protein